MYNNKKNYLKIIFYPGVKQVKTACWFSSTVWCEGVIIGLGVWACSATKFFF